MKIIIGSDHAGLDLKNKYKELLSEELGYEVTDAGAYSPDAVDYPDIARKVASAVSSGEYEKGVLICGSGIGMSIAANRFKGVRAALCHDLFTAEMSRRHNNANILVVGARVTGEGLALEMLKVFLKTAFDGGRHKMRIDKIEN
ncbi:MAG: ribose 5-phosphate isomerase B [Deltaproteobacteria bacterium]|jgi:ribose 5-phosphate isomerase B|nr:ribose 5-phosphate isomerase B [Deltaproteobacteria bacterium]